MVFPKHEKYKDTKVDWIGCIPAHWSTKAVKYVSLVNPSGDRAQKDEQVAFLPMEAVLTNGQFDASRVDFRNTFPASLTEFKRGDVLLAKITPCFENGKGTFVGELPTLKGIGSTEFHVFRVRKDQLTPRFLYYAIHNEAFRTYAEVFMEGTAGQKRLTTPFISNTKIPVPPIEDQKRIVEFLDRKTSEIDQAIAQKQRLIELLEEQKAILINQAVTKGLNPNVSMRDSEIVWIGEVPAHWKISDLRWIKKTGTSITYGIVQAGPPLEDGIPYIRVSDMSGDVFPETGYLKTSSKIDQKYYRSKVETGDLVITIRAGVGKVLKVPEFLNGANLTQGTAKLSVHSSISTDFVYWAISSPASKSALDFVSKGATFQEITLESLRKLKIPVPPYSEQLAISSFLEAQVCEYKRTIQSIQNEISKFHEFRQILIANTVTGKIKI